MCCWSLLILSYDNLETACDSCCTLDTLDNRAIPIIIWTLPGSYDNSSTRSNVLHNILDMKGSELKHIWHPKSFYPSSIQAVRARSRTHNTALFINSYYSWWNVLSRWVWLMITASILACYLYFCVSLFDSLHSVALELILRLTVAVKLKYTQALLQTWSKTAIH